MSKFDKVKIIRGEENAIEVMMGDDGIRISTVDKGFDEDDVIARYDALQSGGHSTLSLQGSVTLSWSDFAKVIESASGFTKG